MQHYLHPHLLSSSLEFQLPFVPRSSTRVWSPPGIVHPLLFVARWAPKVLAAHPDAGAFVSCKETSECFKVLWVVARNRERPFIGTSQVAQVKYGRALQANPAMPLHIATTPAVLSLWRLHCRPNFTCHCQSRRRTRELSRACSWPGVSGCGRQQGP